MEKYRLLKNNRLIRLFGGLFMAVNLITVVIGSISCVYTFQNVRRMVTDYNLSNLQNIRTLMDIRLASAEKFAQEIYLNVSMSELASRDTIHTPEDRYTISRLINLLQYGVNVNNIVSDAYVYLSKSDTVVSNYGHYNASFFFANYMPDSDVTFEQWREELRAISEPLYASSTLRFSGFDREIFSYYKPFNRYTPGLFGCVVVGFDIDEILDMMKKNHLLSDANTTLQHLPSKNYVVEVGNAQINAFSKTFAGHLGQQIVANTPYGDLLLFKQRSTNNDWEYTTAVPVASFYNKLTTIMAIMLAIIVLQILFGGVLAALFTTQSYRPIKRLSDRVRTLAKDISFSGTDDIEVIQNITTTALMEYGRLREEWDNAKPMLTKSFLSQLLHGNNYEMEYANSHLSQLGELFSEEGFFCAKVYIEDCKEFVAQDTIEEMQLVKLVITNVMEEILQEKLPVVSVDFDMKNLIFLFNFPWSRSDFYRVQAEQTIGEAIRYCQSLFEQTFHIYTSIGVSAVNHGFASLYRCANQAQAALDCKIVSGLYGLNYYREEDLSSRTYQYSLEDEIHLINGVKTGNFEQVKGIFNAIVEQNSLVFSSKSLQIAQCFMVDLSSTLLRVVSELNCPEEDLPIQISDLLQSNSYPQMLEELYRYYEALCGWVNRNKKSHNSQMKEKLVAYIDTHYLDNSLSLVGVADHLGMNPTYLSVFIKEQLGETFINYVLNLRMKRARELLEHTDYSLQEIAVQIGYANSGVFIRVFKKKFGQTPGSYRQNSLAKAQ